MAGPRIEKSSAGSTSATPPTVSGRFAQFVSVLSPHDLGPRVTELAKLRLLDSLATALPARGMKVPELARGMTRESCGRATVIGYGDRLSPIDAAFVNATLVNARSQDDFLFKSHAGAVTVPAALALAETEGRSGAELLTSIVAGYEIVARTYLGGPTMLPRFRASGVAGTVGAAAAACKLLGLDSVATMHALGTAACFAHGFGQGFMSGTTEVKLNIGMASRNGVSAAILAKLGATASPLTFEGDAGFYRAFSNSVDSIDAATDGLGERFLIEDTVYKECPVCIFTQTPIALARRIQPEIDPRDVVKILIRAPEPTYTNPGFTNVAPFASHLQAVVSARFCAAAALLGRPVESYECYDDLNDPQVLAIADKVELTVRTGDEQRVDLVVDCKGGRRFEATGIEMDTLRPTQDKIVAKFRGLVSSVDGINVERVLDVVMRLDTIGDVTELTSLLKPA